MQKPDNVGRRIALQFSVGRFLLPGMYAIALFFFSSVLVLQITDGAHGRTTLGIGAFVLFPLILLATAAAYILVRVRPQIARKAIDSFIDSQKEIISFYEESLEKYGTILTTMERDQRETITSSWNDVIMAERNAILKRIHLALVQIAEAEGAMSPEIKALNQQLLNDAYTSVRECEALELQLESMPLPEVPEEVMEEIKRKCEKVLADHTYSLEHHVAWLNERLDLFRDELAQAQKLLPSP